MFWGNKFVFIVSSLLCYDFFFKVREQRNDRATLSKCLCIIYEMMQSETVTVLTPHLHALMENFVLHYIEVSMHCIVS
jgi:hypothetical protein